MITYKITRKEEEKYSSIMYKDKRRFNSAIEEYEWQRTQLQVCNKCNKKMSFIHFSNNTCGSSPFNRFGTRYKRKDCIECNKYTSKQKLLIKKKMKKRGLPIIPINNVCEICRKKDKLVLDHCHEKTAFRGFLCDACNRSLGIFGDNIDGLLLVLNYLNNVEPFDLEKINNKYVLVKESFNPQDL